MENPKINVLSILHHENSTNGRMLNPTLGIITQTNPTIDLNFIFLKKWVVYLKIKIVKYERNSLCNYV